MNFRTAWKISNGDLLRMYLEKNAEQRTKQTTVSKKKTLNTKNGKEKKETATIAGGNLPALCVRRLAQLRVYYALSIDCWA